MTIYNYTDIALDDNFQPITQANGDFALVEGLDCLTQEIKIEALTTAGELFYDAGFGWSLPDFQQSQSDELTLLELQQRVRAKLAAREEIDTSSIAVSVTTSDIDKLQQLQTAVVWAHNHRAVAEQFEKLKLFPGKFYKAHKLEIDRYRYATKQLGDAGINQPIDPAAFTQKLKSLEAERDALTANQLAAEKIASPAELGFVEQIKTLAIERNAMGHKLSDLREELRLWAAAEIYMRELLGMPEPQQPLPDFSVPTSPSLKSRRQLLHSRKNKNRRRQSTGRTTEDDNRKD